MIRAKLWEFEGDGGVVKKGTVHVLFPKGQATMRVKEFSLGRYALLIPFALRPMPC